MGQIDLYTDGGCSGNPGPGGWAFVIIDGEAPDYSSGAIEGSGGEKATTNNRMELTAVIKGLEAIRAKGFAGHGIDIYTDSQYVQKGITEWIQNWKRKGWLTANKEPVKNKDLWLELDSACQSLKPSWHWVKGHAGNKWNERCDELTQDGIAAQR